MKPDKDFGISVPVRSDAMPFAIDLLFYGSITAAIPAILAWVMRALLPEHHELVLLGNAFTCFGLVQIIFAELKLRHLANPILMNQEDCRILAQEWMCGRAASCSALAAGSIVLYAVLLYPYLQMLFGTVGILLTAAAMLFTFLCCGWIALRSSRTPPPNSPKGEVWRVVAAYLAAIVGYSLPFVVCTWLALTWAH